MGVGLWPVAMRESFWACTSPVLPKCSQAIQRSSLVGLVVYIRNYSEKMKLTLMLGLISLSSKLLYFFHLGTI